MNRHHAFGIEAETEEGVAAALAWVEKELGIQAQGNPDVIVLRYGLFSVEDARRVSEIAAGAAFAGTERAIIIAANRAYHEAQNALLKIFEEPAPGTHLFLVMPTLGGMLPTLRSRVQVLSHRQRTLMIPEVAQEFITASKEKRSALIKKLASGNDDETRRENREKAIALLNGVEAAALEEDQTPTKQAELLRDIAELRGYLYDRSAPVRMILEHLSLIIPKGLPASRRV